MQSKAKDKGQDRFTNLIAWLSVRLFYFVAVFVLVFFVTLTRFSLHQRATTSVWHWLRLPLLSAVAAGLLVAVATAFIKKPGPPV